MSTKSVDDLLTSEEYEETRAAVVDALQATIDGGENGFLRVGQV